jgi:pyruvate/2-oxoglutarate dehydrogenase complex dihydrolipoamide acyltransferase (E2) component
MTTNTLDRHEPLDTRHQTLPFSRMRNFMIDTSNVAQRKNNIHLLFEADISEPRRQMRLYAERTGETLSFTGFISYCLAKAIDEDEDKRMHAIRRGNELVVFDTVDVVLAIEKDVEGHAQPVHYVVRSVNKRGFLDVQAEITRAAALPFEQMYPNAFYVFYTKFPGWLRTIMNMISQYSPRAMKAAVGTTAVTSVGMFAPGPFHMVPLVGLTSCLAVGGIHERREEVDGHPEVREFVSLTLSVDHDIIDGAHAARFIARFKDLVKSCHGLPTVSEGRLAVARGG